MPDNDEVSNTGNGIPAPLLGRFLVTEGGKETGQDHDEISNDSHGDVTAVEAGDEGQVEQEKRSGDAPVDVTCPVDLTEDVGLGVWDVLVLLGQDDLVEGDTVTSGHGEVGDCGCHHNDGGDDMIETFGLRVNVSDESSSCRSLLPSYIPLGRSKTWRRRQW